MQKRKKIIEMVVVAQHCSYNLHISFFHHRDIDLFYNGDCQLCNKAYTNLPQHLLSRQHTDQVTRIENEVNR